MKKILGCILISYALNACNSGGVSSVLSGVKPATKTEPIQVTITTEQDIINNKEYLSNLFNTVVLEQIDDTKDEMKTLFFDFEVPFDRKGFCGFSSEAIYKYIQKQNNNILKSLISGYEVKDASGGNHIYLKAGINTLIEPTYKQFLLNSSNTEGYEGAKSYIQQSLPDVFIGDKEDLFDKVKGLHEKFPQNTNTVDDFKKNYDNEHQKQFLLL